MLNNYLKITLRNVLKHKGYSAINISGLAIALTACILISIYVRFELSYDDFHKDADRIFRIVVDIRHQTGDIKYASTPSSLALALKNDCPQVEQAARLMTNPEILIRYGNDKKFLENRIFYTDPEIFELLDIPFLHGDSKSCLRRPRTVVITEEIAQKYFDDDQPLGKLLDFGYAQFEVTGIVKNVPLNSHLKFDFLLSLKPFDPRDWTTQGWNNIDGQSGLVYTYIKCRPQTDIQSLQTQVNHISEKYLSRARLNEDVKQVYSLQPIRDIHLHSNRRNEMEPPGSATNTAVFSIIAVLILIIACLNFINMTTARVTTRSKEIGMRKILGAFRPNLLGGFLGESLLFFIIALLIAFVLVELLLPWFNIFTNRSLNPNTLSDLRFIFPLVLLVSFTGLIAGIYPALILSSISPVNIFRGFQVKAARGAAIRRFLVIFQFTASIALIIAALVIYKQLDFMKKSDLGFDKNQLLVLPVPVGSLFNKNSAEVISNEFTRHHSVVSTATTSFIPGATRHLFKGSVKSTDDPKSQDINIMMIDHDFVKTYGIDLAAGRSFDKNRPTDESAGCLINEAAVKTFGWPSANKAVGKKIVDFQEREVLGVVKDFHYQSLQHKIEPLLLMINPDFYMYLTLRINRQNLSETMAFVKRKWSELFPNEPFAYHVFRDIFDNQYQADKQFGRIVLLFTGFAIFVACLGLYGLTLFAAECRTKEIGIRKVQGATVTNIVKLLSKDFVKLVLLANVIAWPAAWYFMHKWLQNFAYRVDIGFWVFAVSGGLALIIALLTVSAQAIKAALANPVESLRYE